MTTFLATPPAMSDTLIVPVTTLSQRYDSNVFASPDRVEKTKEDWVSTGSVQLNMMHRGDIGQVTAQLLGIGTRYINNPGLSYFGGGGNLSLNLNHLVQKYEPRLSLTIVNGAFYLPNAPAFNPGNIDADPDAFARGIQVVRVNTFSNSSSAVATYSLSQNTSLRASYTYSLIRFGHSFVDVGTAGLVDTNAQTVNAGPQFRIGPQDTIGINYLYQRTDFVGGQVPGFPGKFETHGGTLGWMRGWSRELRTNIYGGATSVDEGGATLSAGTASTPQGGSSFVTYRGGVAMIYTDLSTASGGDGGMLGAQGGAIGTMAGMGGIGGMGGFGGPAGGAGAMGMVGGASKLMMINYSVGVFPSFFGGGIPLISHLVSGAVFRRLGTAWAVMLGGDYARNDSLSEKAGAADIKFQTYGGNAAFSYFITPTMFASISGDYHKFEGQGLALAGVLAGGNTTFDRGTTTISLTKLWF